MALFTRRIPRSFGFLNSHILGDSSPHGKRLLRSGYSSLSRQSSLGKSVIVTGSARGIGKAIALRLAEDGYNVCVNDISANEAVCDNVVKEIQGIGRQACTAVADVSKRDQVKKMIEKSVDVLGPLNTMVANAGIAQVKPLLEVSEEDCRHMFDVNVIGVHNCFVEAASQLIRQGTCKPDSPGKLIAAASIVAFTPFSMLSNYNASKWAVRGLGQIFAKDLAKHHITANCYAPGIVDTKMWEYIDAEVCKDKGWPKGQAMRKAVEDNTALGRTCKSEDVAKLVSFLASSDSDFITGQTQVVDGGIVYT